MRYTYLLFLLLPMRLMAMPTEEKGEVIDRGAEGYEVQLCAERMEIMPLPVMQESLPLPTSLTQMEIKVMPTVNMVSVMPYTDLCNLVSVWEGVYQQQRGAAALVRGGRPGELLYVIDGMRIDNEQ